MKIAILTHPPRLNYGGILQAYALQNTLENMGHQVQILSNNHIGNHPDWKLPIVYINRIIKKCLGKSNIVVFWEKRMRKNWSVISQNTQKFIDGKLNIKMLKSLSELQSKDFDVYVVGSDQIWRAKYTRQLWRTTMPNVFLSFTKSWDVKRIAFAASFGIDNIEEYTHSEIEQCKQALQMFNKVTVRETSGVAICRDKFGREALQVIDPTMLLRKEDYVHLLSAVATKKSDGTLMTYILDPNSGKQKIISSIAEKTGLRPFKANADSYNETLDIDKRVQPSVEQWIRNFLDAKLIITDSYHACVFSIIFNKPFIVIGNINRGLTRFESLLNTFGLERRLLKENQDYDTLIEENIDWESVNNILEKHRKFGLKILQNI